MASKEVKSERKPNPPVDFEKMVELFWENKPYIKDINKYNELEVKFGTKGIKPLNKIDYDNVIQKLKSLGFKSQNEQGIYLLRIQNEFLDSITGAFRLSPIRAEIEGFHAIQNYCKHNDIKKTIANYTVEFYNKTLYSGGKDTNKVLPVNFDDFNFRVSYNTENKIRIGSAIINNVVDSWEKSKKMFRYINRVTFQHDSLPIKVDISIVKSSKFLNKKPVLEYTTREASLFENPEIYEIELEVDNYNIGPGTETSDTEILMATIRRSIKYVLMGLQQTNFPISYTEQRNVLQEYMKLINGDKYEPNMRIYPSNFIGPSSATLQIQNIAPINENTNIPNIRNEYTVTEKADGLRCIMFILENGRIYLINTNMNVLFTGAQTDVKELFNTLTDGELILHDKYGDFINLYAAFDIYYIDKKDIRTLGFVQRSQDELKSKYRLPILKHVMQILKPKSIIRDEPCPITIESKQFYPINPYTDNIFDACNYILRQESEGLFKYKTDGLIFTPAAMGVGSNIIGKAGPLNKSTWDYSFKWKPAHHNTVDFLVTTKKAKNGLDEVVSLFQGGLQTSSVNQISEYKIIVLRCGFDENKHGYINPCQDVINDKLPIYGAEDKKGARSYVPMQFFPTNPYDPAGGICNIMLKKDSTGVQQMFTEDNEVFGDNTIVEFRYDLNEESGWRWIPIKVRYDKTAELRNGNPNFGNAYHVANSNWHSIHNPITEQMICTGASIPDELADDDVYYNKNVGTSNTTRSLRDFHNLFVKKLLITSVAKREDTLIDYACGKGGDFPKWIQAKLSFVFGIDIAKDNLENRLDGACARFLNYRKKFKNIPYALFVNGNSSLNIRKGAAMLSDKAKMVTRAVFGNGPKEEEKLGKGVSRQYGKGEDGFSISSCQFALHYFFETQTTLQNFISNIAECTKLGGYFIGTCYDGQLIFNLLKKKEYGESIEIYDNDQKIWEIRKEYDEVAFEDDASSLGYKIDVFQESIGKMFSEYLVNFDYLNRVLQNYGFKILKRDEAKQIGIPEGSGLFEELFNVLKDEVKINPFKKNEYGDALSMSPNDKTISFLNRYFVFKKISHVNAEKIALESIDELVADRVKVKRANPYKKDIKSDTEKIKVKKAKSLHKKIILVASSEPIEEEEEKEGKEERKEGVKEREVEVEEIENPIKIKIKKPRAKKVKLVIEPNPEKIVPETEVTVIQEEPVQKIKIKKTKAAEKGDKDKEKPKKKKPTFVIEE
jgi:hypothetical protein